MSIIKGNKGTVEYYYFPKNKFPHQVALVPPLLTAPNWSFNTEFYQKIVNPWLEECIGEYGVSWENIHDYKKVEGNRGTVCCYAFNFLTEEDAAFFKLTWG